MQAVILAGGKGTRLRPFTTVMPKPLVPVGDKPIIEIILRQLKHHGFRDVVISTGHLAHLVEAFCGDGRPWGLRVRYVREKKPLSTAGALKLIPRLEPDFLTINGDTLTTLDFRRLFEAHRRSGAWATAGVCRRKSVVDFGVVELDAANRLTRYVEKPAFRYLVSMGVNVFKREALEPIRRGEAIGIPELIGRLQKAERPVMGFRNDAEWLDIGRPEDYEAAQKLLSKPGSRRLYLK